MENVILFQKSPNATEAEKIIQELVQKGAISWSRHCKERMRERGITIQQVTNCLSKGRVTETPFLSQENGGGYETRMEKITAGEWLRVAVCIKFTQRLLIITAIK